VTGASGFLGRQCIRALQDRGWEVHAVRRRADASGLPDAHWHRADLLETGSAAALIGAIAPSHLLHLAWDAGAPAEVLRNPQNLRWVGATLGLARAFVEAGGSRAVFAGTCREYDWSHGTCREDTPLAPRSIYSACKNALREILETYGDDRAVAVVWARIFWIYGPHEPPSRLLPTVIRALLEGAPAPCPAGSRRRDYLSVGDAGAALADLVEAEVTGPVNVGSGTPTSLKELFRIVGDLTGRPDLIRMAELPSRAEDPPLVAADVRRLSTSTGWQPKVTLEAGLAEAVEWWRREVLSSQSGRASAPTRYQ
jgi:nucleoside-diphosphate-sugar epimerase